MFKCSEIIFFFSIYYLCKVGENNYNMLKTVTFNVDPWLLLLLLLFVCFFFCFILGSLAHVLVVSGERKTKILNTGC